MFKLLVDLLVFYGDYLFKIKDFLWLVRILFFVDKFLKISEFFILRKIVVSIYY